MILGIDIGTNNLGFAILDNTKKLIYKEYLDLKGFNELKTLNLVYEKLDELKSKYNISKVALEHIFISPGFKAGGTIKIVEAVGVVMLFCYDNNLLFKKINIKTIKKQITGNGNAKKEDMIKEINTLYKLKNKNEHIADAIGVALTYLILEA